MQLTVTVEITAVEFRRLNSFEWAVLSLLNTFEANAPTIADATSQLCLSEPAFLAAALENLCSAGAVQPKTDELRAFDLNDYKLSEIGKTILRQEGWEGGREEVLQESMSLQWPSMRLVFNGRKEGARQQSGPLPDEVQAKLTLENVQTWLNKNDNLRHWRVKAFYVTNVES